jgi:dTDP-glucose 4,6-dehydratase
MGKSEDAIEYVTDRPGHDRRYAVDWSETRKELGWQPHHSFDEYLALTVKWYQEHEDWWKKIKNKA